MVLLSAPPFVGGAAFSYSSFWVVLLLFFEMKLNFLNVTVFFENGLHQIEVRESKFRRKRGGLLCSCCVAALPSLPVGGAAVPSCFSPLLQHNPKG